MEYIYPNELAHHGVLGQKWGVRRYQNEDGSYTKAGLRRLKKKESVIKKINTMYDYNNKWTERKITRLDKKRKTVKANVMRELYRNNENARKSMTSALQNASLSEFNEIRSKTRKDYWFGGQEWKALNSNKILSTPLSRLGEYERARGIRWQSNYTFSSTLKDMPAKDALDYLDRKHTASKNYNRGQANSNY